MACATTWSLHAASTQALRPIFLTPRPSERPPLLLGADPSRRRVHREGEELINRQLVQFQSRISAIRGNTVTLERRLPVDVETRWKPQLRTLSHRVKEVGVERLTFRFKGSTYRGHFKERGNNALVMNNVVEC